MVDCSETVAYVPGDDHAACATGTRSCSGGKWGACSAQSQSIVSVPPAIAKSTTASACTGNPCDPTCSTYTDGSADIDASAVASTDSGGIAIAVTDASTDGPVGGDGSACTGLQCSINSCIGLGGYTATKLTGKVYDPAGLNPLPNVLVYIPNAALSPFTSGISCTSACPTGSGSPIVSATTDASGAFTLSGVPSGSGVPLVIQSGKWRRKVTLPAITPCTTNDVSSAKGSDSLPLARMPQNRGEGDIPKIAFVSGGADPFECVLMKMGLDVSSASHEIGFPSPTGAQRVDYYLSPNVSYSAGVYYAAWGADLSTAIGGTTASRGPTTGAGAFYVNTNAPFASSLWSSATTLANYDAVILACEGSAYDNGSTANSNLYNYVNGGGRLFLTHYSYTSLVKSQPSGSLWPTSSVGSSWSTGYADNYGGTEPVFVDTSFPKGNTFAQWLNNVGASTTLGQLNLLQSRKNFVYANRSVATSWAYGNISGSTSFGAANGASCTSHTACASGYCNAPSYSVPINGGFESGLSGWTTTGSVVSASTTAHSGAKSLQLGTSSPTTDNSASQTFTAPAGAIQLSLWYENFCPDSITYDWALVTLKDNTSGVTSTLVNTCATSASWTNVTAPVTAGHSYTLTLANHDDNYAGDPTYTLFDDVAFVGGTCASKSCSTSADCPASAQGSFCNNAGTCLPPHDYEPLMTFNVPIGAATQCGRVVYSDFHVSASSTNGLYSTFPEECISGALSPQEKALEYMLFDLTSCLTPDYVPPPAPPKYSAAVTVSRTYTASCGTGMQPVWHYFDYLDHTPSNSSGTTSISFSLQTGNTPAAVAAMTPVNAATVTTTYTTWGTTGADGGTLNNFDVAALIAPASQGNILQVNITLTPSPDGALTPVLDAWRQAYDCVPSE